MKMKLTLALILIILVSCSDDSEDKKGIKLDPVKLCKEHKRACSDVNSDHPEAEALFKIGCDANDWYACTVLGQKYENHKKLMDAKKSYQKACEHGDEYGCEFLRNLMMKQCYIEMIETAECLKYPPVGEYKILVFLRSLDMKLKDAFVGHNFSTSFEIEENNSIFKELVLKKNRKLLAALQFAYKSGKHDGVDAEELSRYINRIKASGTAYEQYDVYSIPGVGSALVDIKRIAGCDEECGEYNLLTFKSGKAIKKIHIHNVLEFKNLDFPKLDKYLRYVQKDGVTFVLISEWAAPKSLFHVVEVATERVTAFTPGGNFTFHSFKDYDGDGTFDILSLGGRGEPRTANQFSYDPFLIYKGVKGSNGTEFKLDEKLSQKWSLENKFEWHGSSYSESIIVDRNGKMIEERL
jgi:hypothetical protein